MNKEKFWKLNRHLEICENYDDLIRLSRALARYFLPLVFV